MIKNPDFKIKWSIKLCKLPYSTQRCFRNTTNDGSTKYTISQYVYEAIQELPISEALKKNTNSLYYLGQVLRMISLATINPHIIRNTQTESTELQLQESDLIPSIDTESDLEHVIIELKKPEYSKALYNIFYNPDVINYFNDLFMIDYKPLFEGFILSSRLPKTFLGEKYIKTKKAHQFYELLV